VATKTCLEWYRLLLVAGVAVCCSVCCSVCYSVLQHASQRDVACCSVLQRVAVCIASSSLMLHCQNQCADVCASMQICV